MSHCDSRGLRVFEAAEVGRAISKAEYRARSVPLRAALLEAQAELRDAQFSVLILFAGVDGAGKSETANLLNEWMDPRFIDTCAFDEPSDEERERPLAWRYWRRLPAEGRIGIFLRAWYSAPVLDRVAGGSSSDQDARLQTIVVNEEALTDDGNVVIKFWMHLGKKAQKKRMKALSKDPLERWRVTKKDRLNWKKYDAFIEAAERTITVTSVPAAPWHIVEGTCRRYRSLRVGELLLAAIKRRLQAGKDGAFASPDAAASPPISPRVPVSTELLPTVLSNLSMDQAVGKAEYNRQLKEQQARLHALWHKARQKGMATVVAFEGWDAAGKGGAIRRLTVPLDARWYQVVPVAAPTDEEKAHHYLWRFWRHVPRSGYLSVFDRSWYGRVLVERVESITPEARWRAAYSEINDFEQALASNGTLICKFWIHITRDEQERRFQERQATPLKRWKLTAEDWRNRERWDDYEVAVHEMVERTSTHFAPWTLVEGNQKRFARLKVLRTVCDRFERFL